MKAAASTFRAADYMVISEVTAVLGYSRQTVVRLIEAGDLDGFRLGDRGWHKVTKQSVKALAARLGRQRKGRA